MGLATAIVQFQVAVVNIEVAPGVPQSTEQGHPWVLGRPSGLETNKKLPFSICTGLCKAPGTLASLGKGPLHIPPVSSHLIQPLRALQGH